MEEHLEQASLYSVVMGFYHAVEWTEPWLISLMGLHVACFGLFVLTRSHALVQVALWFLTLVLVAAAPLLNVYGQEHWRDFATQDYFDENGFFLSVVLCMPMLLLAILILVQFLWSTMNLLVDVKVKQFKREMKAKKNQ